MWIIRKKFEEFEKRVVKGLQRFKNTMESPKRELHESWIKNGTDKLKIQVSSPVSSSTVFVDKNKITLRIR